MINLSFIGQNRLEILHAVRHTGKLKYVMNKALMPLIKGATLLNPHTGNPGPQSNSKQKIDYTFTITWADRLSQKISDGTENEFYIRLESTMKSRLKRLERKPSVALARV